jgi:myosin heavy subunit
MSYTQYPSAAPQEGSNQPVANEPKKDNRNLIYALLIGALICTWGYIIYDKSKVKEEKIQYVDRITKDSVDRSALQQQFNMLSGKADSITINNQQLQGALAEKNNDIQKLRNNIAATLKKKNITSAELAEAQKQIGELQGKIESLTAEVEKLQAENKQLTASNDQLNTDKKQLTEEKGTLQTDLTKTKEEKAKVEDVASTLHASNIGITAIDLRGSKEKETTKAKKVDYFKVTFDIDENRIAPSGSKSLMVCIYHPDGSLSMSAGSFTDRAGKTVQYTNKVDINYVQGVKLPVSFQWKPGNKFETGVYRIEIYNNGFKIGEGKKSLDKSTFLGL